MLYLPLTTQSVHRFAQSNNTAALIAELSIPELAALVLLQKLQDFASSAPSRESLLSKTEQSLAYIIKAIETTPRTDLDLQVTQNFKAVKLTEGLGVLEKNAIHLMTAQQVSKQAYLDSRGHWDWNFKTENTADFIASKCLERIFIRKTGVTQDQEHILKIILAERDEPLDIQGYAGTGKTKLISHLVDVLDENKLLLLAMNGQQLKSMASRLNKKPICYTFGGLAKSILKNNFLGLAQQIGSRNRQQYSFNFNEVAELIQCHPLGDHSAQSVAMAAYKTVSQYCFSASNEIMLCHVDKSLNKPECNYMPIVQELAIRLWKNILIPKKGKKLPIRNFHLVKALALSGEPIPNIFTHIIIDETHDLPLPISQILHRTPQTVFSFGDNYQALGGIQTLNRRSQHIRNRQMCHSVRAGKNIAHLFNKIISYHPLIPQLPFIGSTRRKTKLTYYEKFSFQDSYCALLCRNSWYVFALMQRLAKSGSTFRIIDRTRNDLKWLIGGAILFYREQIKPAHPFFYAHESWQSFVCQQNNPIINKIDKLFTKGYAINDLEQSLSKEEKSNTRNAYILGKIEDSKNMEFDSVVLMHDLLNIGDHSKLNRAKVISHIYTGMSRAKHELIIPAQLEAWIEDNFGKTQSDP